MNRKESNRIAVAKHYQLNSFAIQRKRKMKDIRDGKKVRVDTIVKYGLEAEAKEAGLAYEEMDVPNQVPQAFIDETSIELKKQIEKKLSQYDDQIAEMVKMKLNQAKQVAKGKPRIESGEKLTWTDLRAYINQVPDYSKTTKNKYLNDLKHLVTIILKCKPNTDIVNCFNDHKEAIKAIKSAKNPQTQMPYKTYGRFFSLPISFEKHIPEFQERLAPGALKAFKTQASRQ